MPIDSHSPFERVGFAAAEFTFAQPNGVGRSAPLEFWVAAILTVLTESQRASVLARVEAIANNAMEVKSTDGYPLIVSR